MTSRSKKGDQKGENDPPNTVLPAIADMLAKHEVSLMTKFQSEFNTAFSKLEERVDKFQNTLLDHQHRLSSLETFADSTSQDMKTMEAELAAISEANAKLQTKLVDLEGRSRRNNIRIVGLPENIEGAHPTAFFSQVLVEVIGDQILSSTPELDRAHRTLAPKPGPNGKARPVIIRFLKFQERELVVREARRLRGKLNYRGSQIHIFEDYSPEVAEQRSEYRAVMKQLYDLGLKPTLLFPARLFIRPETGPRRHLPSLKAAQDFIASQRQSSSGSTEIGATVN
ncbi:hypothetical protein R3I94_013542 [Phoxinus phoxinus]|uniref:L1 transposable element RRM domain-containing protein n=1 Tax=Phoxinus phoxinus TaxID=58324 RepID=A0AAN9GVJ3_9TELE